MELREGDGVAEGGGSVGPVQKTEETISALRASLTINRLDDPAERAAGEIPRIWRATSSASMAFCAQAMTSRSYSGD
jgi:hypothetical protein